MKEELHLAQCEINTLKRLLVGKDTLLVQKSQALEMTKVSKFYSFGKMHRNVCNILCYVGP